MTGIQALVAEFHEAFNVPARTKPTVDVEPWEAGLRVRLIREEAREVEQAIRLRDLHQIAQELADLAYVVYGAALHYGIDLDRAVAEVHRANMSKLDEHGQPIYRPDGKVLKSDRYRPPDMAAALRPTTDADLEDEAWHELQQRNGMTA